LTCLFALDSRKVLELSEFPRARLLVVQFAIHLGQKVMRLRGGRVRVDRSKKLSPCVFVVFLSVITFAQKQVHLRHFRLALFRGTQVPAGFGKVLFVH